MAEFLSEKVRVCQTGRRTLFSILLG